MPTGHGGLRRVRTIGHLLGILLLILAGCLLLPLGVALLYGEGQAGQALALTQLVAVGAGLGLWLRSGPPEELTHRDGFALATLGWVAVSLVGALPFYLSGVLPGFVDALFESMSGFTTTGASVLPAVQGLPRGLLFWRSFTHWLGGMGIIVLFVAVLPRLGTGGAQLFRAESPGPVLTRLAPRMAETARFLWLIYLGLSLTQVILLCLARIPVFEAVTHTFATMGTGGFSTYNNSVESMNNPVAEMIFIVFMIAAGSNFALYYRALRGQRTVFLHDPEFRFYIGVAASSSLLIAFSLWRSAMLAPLQALRHAAFQTVSILTTTGFTTTDFGQWPPFARLLLLLLMFVGGCAGSTGGAIKCLRVLILFKHGWREVLRTFYPRAVIHIKLQRRVVSEEVVASVLGFALLYLLIFVAASLALTAMGVDLLTAASAVAATLGNIGPGLEAVGPSTSYLNLPVAAKLVLSTCMLLGRLEIYTVVVLILMVPRRLALGSNGRAQNRPPLPAPGARSLVLPWWGGRKG